MDRPARWRDERVVPAPLGDRLGDELQVAEVVGHLVLAADVVDKVLDLDHVARAQPLEADDLGAVVVVKAVPGLGEILVAAIGRLQHLEPAARVAPVDARLADVDLLAAGRVVDVELLVLLGAALGEHLDDPLGEGPRQAVLVDAHDAPVEQHHGGVARGRRRGRARRDERARLLGEAARQLVGGGRIAVLAGGEAIDVAFELRILRAQRQRDAQPPERLVGPAQPMEELAERDQRGRIIGQARRERGEGGERPSLSPAPSSNRARSIASDGRSGRSAAAAARRARASAPSPRARARAASWCSRSTSWRRSSPAPPACHRWRSAGRPPHRDAPPPGARAAAPARQPAATRTAPAPPAAGPPPTPPRRAPASPASSRGRSPAPRGTTPPRALRAVRSAPARRAAPAGARGRPARSPARRPARESAAARRRCRRPPPPPGRPPATAARARDRSAAAAAACASRSRGADQARSRARSSQASAAAAPRASPPAARAAHRASPPALPCVTRRRPRGVRRGNPLRGALPRRRAERRARGLGEARVEAPGAVDDDRLDQDPVPAPPESHRRRVLIEQRWPHHVAREHLDAVHPDLDRPGRAEAQRRCPIAIAVHERRDVGDRLIVGAQQAVEIERPLAHRRVAGAPGDVAHLAGVAASELGRRALRLGRKRRAEARAPLAERADHQRMRQKTEAASQRGRLVGRARARRRGAPAERPPARRRAGARRGPRPARTAASSAAGATSSSSAASSASAAIACGARASRASRVPARASTSSYAPGAGALTPAGDLTLPTPSTTPAATAVCRPAAAATHTTSAATARFVIMGRAIIAGNRAFTSDRSSARSRRAARGAHGGGGS